MGYYRTWLAVPLVLPLLYVAGLALTQRGEMEQQIFVLGGFFVFGWLPYACMTSCYYFKSGSITADEMRAELIAAPLRMLCWVLGVIALCCISSLWFLMAIPYAAIATLVVGYGVVSLALGLEAVLLACGILQRDF
jgi:hypothetical protein